MKIDFLNIFLSLIMGLQLSLLFSQNDKDNKLLRRLPLDSLLKIEASLDENTDSESLINIYTAIAANASKIDDIERVVWSKYRLAWLLDYSKGEELFISTIHQTKDLKKQSLYGKSLFLTGVFYYEYNKPIKALRQFIQAYDVAVASKNMILEVDAINAIASIKSEYGEENEALKLQLEAFSILKNYNEELHSFEDTYMVCVDNLALAYLQLKKVDSARYFTNLGIQQIKNSNDLNAINEFRILEAQVNYYDNNFIKSRDSILKYIPFMESDGKADLFYYLGMISGKIGDNHNKLIYFSKMDSVLNELYYPLIDNSKELYQYLSLNDTKSRDTYLNRLVYYDSLQESVQNDVESITLQEFELKRKKDSRALFSSTNTKIVLGCIVFLIFLILFLSRKYLRETKEKLDHIRGINVQCQEVALSNQNKVNLDPDIISRILESLENWENTNGYLDKSITLNELAELLNTNSSYLSKIINAYKGKNFANYLKDLRLTYALKAFRNNPELIFGKSIFQIAEQFGFKSKEIFAKSFKSRIGVTPTVYLKRLKSDNL